jgi:hypothetical protein
MGGVLAPVRRKGGNPAGAVSTHGAPAGGTLADPAGSFPHGAPALPGPSLVFPGSKKYRLVGLLPESLAEEQDETRHVVLPVGGHHSR